MYDYNIDKKWIDRYLHTNYVGYVKDKYDLGCALHLKDINNFIVNVGCHADLVIMRMDGEFLLNTRGVFLDRILPDHAVDILEEMQVRNYIASVLQGISNEQGDGIAPLKKVSKFIEEAIEQGIINTEINALYESDSVQKTALNLGMSQY